MKLGSVMEGITSRVVSEAAPLFIKASMLGVFACLNPSIQMPSKVMMSTLLAWIPFFFFFFASEGRGYKDVPRAIPTAPMHFLQNFLLEIAMLLFIVG